MSSKLTLTLLMVSLRFPHFLLSIFCSPFSWLAAFRRRTSHSLFPLSVVSWGLGVIMLRGFFFTIIVPFLTSMEMFHWTIVTAFIFRRTTTHFLRSVSSPIIVFWMRFITTRECNAARGGQSVGPLSDLEVDGLSFFLSHQNFYPHSVIPFPATISSSPL